MTPRQTSLGELREQVAAGSRALAAAGLVPGTSGNLSASADGLIAVTPTGVALGDIQAADVTVVDLDGGRVEGPHQPTSEIDIHLALNRERGDCSIAHTHAPIATALACVLEGEVPVVHYAALLLGGPIRIAPYTTFGTPELARAVSEALSGRDAALMAGHGAVSVGRDARQAVDRMLLLEWLCEVYWRASAIGQPRVLSDEQQREARERLASAGLGAAMLSPSRAGSP